MSPEILGVLGVIISILLAINAYFIKELVESITKVRIDLNGLFERQNAGERRIDTAENNQKDIFKRIYNLEIKDRRR